MQHVYLIILNGVKAITVTFNSGIQVSCSKSLLGRQPEVCDLLLESPSHEPTDKLRNSLLIYGYLFQAQEEEPKTNKQKKNNNKKQQQQQKNKTKQKTRTNKGKTVKGGPGCKLASAVAVTLPTLNSLTTLYDLLFF